MDKTDPFARDDAGIAYSIVLDSDYIYHITYLVVFHFWLLRTQKVNHIINMFFKMQLGKRENEEG